jgi:Tetracyclin repressor-like, C-terminal domain
MTVPIGVQKNFERHPKIAGGRAADAPIFSVSPGRCPHPRQVGSRVGLRHRNRCDRALSKHSDYTSASLKSYNDAPDAVRAAARQHRQRYEAVWSQLIDEITESGSGPDKVSPETLRLAALGMMNWSPEWYRAGRHSIKMLASEFAAILLH